MTSFTIFSTIGDSASFGIEWKLGLLCGFVHHLICQYPRQIDLLLTIFTYLIANVAFAVLKLTTGIVSFQIMAIGMLIFNVVYSAFAISLKVTFNVYFRHPRIPSTFWLSATDLGFWSIYYKNGSPHHFLSKLHDKLGDVVRIQPNHISFRSVEGIEAIYGPRTKCRKSDAYDYVFRARNAPASLVTVTDFSRHAFLRRLIGQALASPGEFEPTIIRYITKFLDRLEPDKVIDINNHHSQLAFDIIGGLSYARDFKDEECEFFVKILHKYIILIGTFMPVPWVAKFFLAFFTPKALQESRYRIIKFSQGAVQEKMKNLNEKDGNRTLLASIIKAIDPETNKKLSDVEILVSANMLIQAGSDTTATAMTFTLYYLLSNRQYWDRLCQDIRSRFTSIDEITHVSMSKIRFLEAVINEALRLRPPIPMSLPRRVPDEGMTIAGCYIPGGTIVSVPTWSIHHNKQYFSNPDKFIPTRWIDEEKLDETCNKAAWIPFSFGLRNCVAKALALMELRLTIAMFAFSFDAELVEQVEPLYIERFVAIRGPLFVRVKRVCA